MKHTINCDAVFEILTRAPFPTGEESDEDVELHLAICPDCRRLAEALRPALELFHEAVSPEEVNKLPGYFGELSPRLDPRHEGRPVRNRTTGLRATPGREGHRAIWRFLAGAMLGACGGLLVWFAGAHPTRNAPPQAWREAAARNVKLVAFLDEIDAPADCYPPGITSNAREVLRVIPAEAGAIPPEPNRAAQCCTYCHAAGNPGRPRGGPGKILQACRVCHNGQSAENVVDGV